MACLRDRLRDDAMLTNGAGNFTVWAHRFYEFRRYGTQLAPRSGRDGLRRPRRGRREGSSHPDRDRRLPRRRRRLPDDAARSSPPRSSTAAAIVVLVVNNGMYGTIRMHQERNYPAACVGTDLVNPDFVAYARAFGAHGDAGRAHRGLRRRLRRGARRRAGPALLELRVDPEAITPRQTLTEIRDAV